jgi:hypothetical protein
MQTYIVKFDVSDVSDVSDVEMHLIGELVSTPIQKKSILCSIEMLKLLQGSIYFKAPDIESSDYPEILMGTFCGYKVFYNPCIRASESFIRNEADEKIVKISFEKLDSFHFDNFI